MVMGEFQVHTHTARKKEGKHTGKQNCALVVWPCRTRCEQNKLPLGQLGTQRSSLFLFLFSLSLSFFFFSNFSYTISLRPYSVHFCLSPYVSHIITSLSLSPPQHNLLSKRSSETVAHWAEWVEARLWFIHVAGGEAASRYRYTPEIHTVNTAPSLRSGALMHLS